MTRAAYWHAGGSWPLTAETVDERFRAVVAEHRDRDCLVGVATGRRLSYAATDRETQRIARGLIGLGVTRGHRVGVWATNHVEWVLVQLATARIGAVLVNVNPAYRVGELEYALNLAQVQTLITMPGFRRSDYVAMVSALCPEASVLAAPGLSCARLPSLRHVVLFDPGGVAERPARGWLTWDELLGLGDGVADDAVGARAATLECDDPINIQFTSGTTGAPKAVLLTHHNILNNAIGCAWAMSLTPADRLCVPVPFYHCFGMVVSTLACLSQGAALVIPSEHFDPEAALDAIEDERCTAVHGVPTMFVAMLEELQRQPRDLAALRTGIMAGAPCPPELVRAVTDEMGCAGFLVAYGQTEASPVTHCTRSSDSAARRVQTVGTNMPHTEVRIVDTATGRTAHFGDQGEVCFRGYHVMRGYFASEEATRQAIDDAGWLHSGDLGVLDAHGYLRLTGRLKDMVIRGGENIYPAEIEAVLFEHPAVEDVAVFGVADERMGEEVGAWVRPHAGLSLTEDEVRAFVRQRLAHFKVPRYVWFVERFPMTVTGKKRKVEMREVTARWLETGTQAGW